MTQSKSKPTLSNLSEEKDLSDVLEVEMESEDSLGDEGTITKPYDPKQIRVDPKSFSLRNVLDMIKEGDLDLAPDFQRMKVWTPRQKSRLIESIFLRIPLPAFYFSSDKEGYMQVVDGVQRLSTIYDFVRNDGFALQHLEYLDHELGGQSYSQIEKTVWAKRINTTQITVNVIDPQTPPRVTFDIFKRINTGGTPLNSQEIRHCMSGKRSRELLKRLTALSSFDEATGKKIAGHLRMADRELALRWVSFELLDNFDDYGGDQMATLDDLLNITTERIDEDSSVNLDSLIARFDRAMANALTLFGRHAFRKWVPSQTGLSPLNRALFEAWSVPLGHMDGRILARRKKTIQEAFRNLCAEDDFFINSISAGTADPKKVRYRFGIIRELLEEKLS
jgi:hypothetical protein